MYDQMQAYDKYTDKPVDDLTAQCAADNPLIYKWVAWR